MGLIMSGMAIMMLMGCGDGATTTGSNSDEPKVLRVAGIYPPDHPTTKNLEEFVKEVNEQSEGALEIKIFPANQLGDYTLVYEELMRGTIDMGLMTAPTQFNSNLNINYVNYLAESYERAIETFAPDSFIYNANKEIHAEQDVKFLGFHFEGMTGIGTTKAIENPANIGQDKNMMIRVPSLESLKVSVESLGFRTVSIDYAELYQALQTGVADGWAGGSPVPNYTDVGDVITHYYAYNNWFETTQLLMSEKVWGTLTEKQQEIIEEASQALYERSLEVSEQNDQDYMKKLEDEYGVEIVEFTPDELETFKQHIQKKSWPKLNQLLEPDYLDGLLDSK